MMRAPLTTSTLPAQVGLQPAAQAESSGITPAILTAAIPSVLLKSDRMFSTTPTETYALVARGATRCWFGAGPLRRSHVFHADADSPLQGGRALIFVHERDTTADQPRGIKAYRIEVAAGTSGGSLVEQENLRFSAPVAEAMQRDVARWAGGDVACGALPIETGVLPAMPAQPIVAKTATTKAGRTATGNKAVATSTINR